MLWFSDLAPSLANALSAKSSAPPIALPSFPPFGPFVEETYVFSDTRACDESCAVGNER